MTRYVITARAISNGAFTAAPGPVSFLRVADTANTFTPDDRATTGRDEANWQSEIQKLADGDPNPNSISPTGDVLVLVHGYANEPPDVLKIHDMMTDNLRAEGWHGLLISFDWPSGGQVLNYLEDRSDAAAVALQLVEQCLYIVQAGQAAGCQTNIHILGHSTGAYVIMEAFVQAQKDGTLFKGDWRLGQVAFISGDVSQSSLALTSDWSAPMFDRIMRLTNYSNPFDAVLAVSNAKRLGVAPRAGRVGLPAVTDQKAVNVNCGDWFKNLAPPAGSNITWTHSWWFTDTVFARDLAMTLEGAIDRNFIPTRGVGPDGSLFLRDEPRPAGMETWGIKLSSQPNAPTV